MTIKSRQLNTSTASKPSQKALNYGCIVWRVNVLCPRRTHRIILLLTPVSPLTQGSSSNAFMNGQPVEIKASPTNHLQTHLCRSISAMRSTSVNFLILFSTKPAWCWPGGEAGGGATRLVTAMGMTASISDPDEPSPKAWTDELDELDDEDRSRRRRRRSVRSRSRRWRLCEERERPCRRWWSLERRSRWRERLRERGERLRERRFDDEEDLPFSLADLREERCERGVRRWSWRAGGLTERSREERLMMGREGGGASDLRRLAWACMYVLETL